MHLLLPILFGVLLGAACWLLLARSLPRMIIGLLLLGNAANIAIFAGGRVFGTAPPIVVSGETVLAAGAANPLPQALVLTAIVISLGLMAFALMLAWATHAATGRLDAEDLHDAEPMGLPAADPTSAAAAEPPPALPLRKAA